MEDCNKDPCVRLFFAGYFLLLPREKEKPDTQARGDLVRTDDNWQEWYFPQLLEALRKWTVRNPPKTEERHNQEKPTTPKPPKFETYHAK